MNANSMPRSEESHNRLCHAETGQSTQQKAAAKEPRYAGAGRDAGRMHAQTESSSLVAVWREKTMLRHSQNAMPAEEGWRWFGAQKWRSGNECAAASAMLAMGLNPPFVLSLDDFEQLVFLLRGMGRRKTARTVKLLADAGVVSEFPNSVRSEARAFNSVPQGLRAKIFERDKVCQECGAGGPLTIDHILARALGGENNEENLRALCLSCNASQGQGVRQELARRAVG